MDHVTLWHDAKVISQKKLRNATHMLCNNTDQSVEWLWRSVRCCPLVCLIMRNWKCVCKIGVEKLRNSAHMLCND